MQLLNALVAISICTIAGAAPDVSPLQRPLSLTPNGPSVLNARLDSAILDILQEFKTPGGVGVAVVSENAQGSWQLESKGYGNATAYGDKVTADTLFAIGSNSKVCTIF